MECGTRPSLKCETNKYLGQVNKNNPVFLAFYLLVTPQAPGINPSSLLSDKLHNVCKSLPLPQKHNPTTLHILSLIFTSRFLIS